MNNSGPSLLIFIHITSVVTHQGSLLPTHVQFYLFLNLSLVFLLIGDHVWQRCTWSLLPAQSPKRRLLCRVTGRVICVCIQSAMIGYEIYFQETHILKLVVNIYVPHAAAFVLPPSPHGSLERDFWKNSSTERTDQSTGFTDRSFWFSRRQLFPEIQARIPNVTSEGLHKNTL